MKYEVILADPPWNFKTWSSKGEGRAPTYPTMNLPAIAAMPIKELAADNCALFLWTLSWLPPRYVGDLIEAWGFKYSSRAFVWMKITKDGAPRMMKGYQTRKVCEDVLLAIKGKMPVEPGARPLELVMAEVGKHSAKPSGVQDKIERMYPNAKRLELFARNNRPGWDAFGNEVDSDIEIDLGD
ncbi:adenine methyltransferase [Candidatus Pacearchaeota archaeon]|nr:adenine methyltransferase [Candidatus Pacearchaeota archaeon]